MTLSLIEKSKFYFYKFPIVDYELNGITRKTLDFIHRWAFKKFVKEDIAAYSEWIIRDEDSIFSMAEALYGSQHYYWVIMMMNSMIDPVFDWPLQESDVFSFIESIYGENNVYDHHHYEAEEDGNIFSLPIGTIVSSNYKYNMKSISNFDYEIQRNEDKRRIKLLLPEYLDEVIKQKDEIVRSNFKRNI